MSILKDKYRCSVCGKMIEVIHDGGGTLTCCNQPMQLINSHTEDAVQEKHLPVVTATANGIMVAVGSVLHPMTAEHYIEWIEVTTVNHKILRQHLQPGQEPKASFNIKLEDVLEVEEYCNIHGLWVNQLQHN